jgi:hypothetical protein
VIGSGVRNSQEDTSSVSILINLAVKQNSGAQMGLFTTEINRVLHFTNKKNFVGAL